MKELILLLLKLIMTRYYQKLHLTMAQHKRWVPYMYILNMSTKLLQHFQLISLVSKGSMKFYLVVEIGNDFYHIQAGLKLDNPPPMLFITRDIFRPKQWIGFFFFERCYSLITATVCAYKLNNARFHSPLQLQDYIFFLKTFPTLHFIFMPYRLCE